MIKYEKRPEPTKDFSGQPVWLTDETMKQRREKVLKQMAEHNYDVLCIYGDVDHGFNLEYLVGFYTRFEEAMLVLHKNGEAYLLLGNENISRGKLARIENTPIHCSYFSLPHQPMYQHNLVENFKEANLKPNMNVGIVGFKYFNDTSEDAKYLFDIPNYVYEAIVEINEDKSKVTNAIDLFIGENGVRRTNNANEIAHYEVGASLSGDSILDALNTVKEGATEYEIGDKLLRYGQNTSIVTIAASGERYRYGNMFPTNKEVKLNDPISITVGYRGGASSRAGIAAYREEDLPENIHDYVSDVAMPYFGIYAAWLENLRIGMKGHEMYDMVKQNYSKEKHYWYLNPGHLTANEEWLASMMYPNSQEQVSSGNIFQVDIIPFVPGYPGASAESTICIADEALRQEIKELYPELYARFEKRQKYLREVLGINISDDILPMASTVGYMRPLMLDHERCLVKVSEK